jgi:DNA-directed RNA polymerase specialized sigma24 family protein
MLRLPERCAMVLALRYAGCSHLEIAQSTGIPVEQVGTYLARAQRAFRKEFSDDPRV